MAHKRYRKPTQGYERNQARDETRTVVEQELFGADDRDATPQSRLAARMADTPPRSTPNVVAESGPSEATAALGALDLDGLVSHAMEAPPRDGRPQRLEDLTFDNATPATGEAATGDPAAGEPTAGLRARSAASRSAAPPIEKRRVTRVHLGASADKARRGGLLSFVNRLLGR